MLVYPSGNAAQAVTTARVKMLGYAREGKMRSKLREAILAGFNPASLDEVLRDNDMLASNVAIGPDFAARVNSLIDVARQEGWLVELCGVLAAARAGNEPVSSAILAVQRWLIDHRETHENDLQFQEDAGLLSKANAAQRRSFWFFNLPLRWLILAALILAIGVLGKAIHSHVTGMQVATGEYDCTANGTALKNCSVSNVSGETKLSFDGANSTPNSLVDSYSGTVVVVGNELSITLFNRFNPNPARSGESQQGPKSSLRLSKSGTGFLGTWSFEGGASYSFSLSKRERRK